MKTFTLSRPTGDVQISLGVQSYVSEKLKDDCFDLVLRAFKESGLSQSEVAARLGKDKALVSRQLSSPSNWTLDTVGRLLFAINGSFIVVSSSGPEDPSKANYTQPSWMNANLPFVSNSRVGPRSQTITFSATRPHGQGRNTGIGIEPQTRQEAPNYRIAAE